MGSPVGAAGRDDRQRQQPEPDQADDDHPGDRPVGKLGGRHDVGDEQRDREEVEEAVREHRPEERGARPLPVRDVPAEDGDTRELAGTRRQHGVSEQADAERGEHLPEGRPRRRHRMVDRHVPGECAREDRQQVEDHGDDHPTPGDEVERVVDGVPVGPAPPERQDREHEHREDEEPASPRVPRERDQPAHAAAASRTGDRGAPATRS
ncbi:MAG: hypothetical protein M5U27_08435 [Gaiella sp.]|nr:hypothetical protein [Gaiella sp.]